MNKAKNEDIWPYLEKMLGLTGVSCTKLVLTLEANSDPVLEITSHIEKPGDEFMLEVDEDGYLLTETHRYIIIKGGDQ